MFNKKRVKYNPYDYITLNEIRSDMNIDEDWVENPPKPEPMQPKQAAFVDQFMMFVFGIFGYFTAILSVKTVDWMIRYKVSIGVISMFFIILIMINLWIFRKRLFI